MNVSGDGCTPGFGGISTGPRAIARVRLLHHVHLLDHRRHQIGDRRAVQVGQRVFGDHRVGQQFCSRLADWCVAVTILTVTILICRYC
jgi:hypothetical protein